MKIMDFLKKEAIAVGINASKKKDVIIELVDLLARAYPIKDKSALIKAIMNREELGSTGIGQGVGIPHAKSNAVKELIGALMVSRNGVNFDSLDGEPTHIFFLLVAPEDAAGPHLKALATISRMLKDKFLRDSIIAVKDEGALLTIIKKEDQNL